MSTLDAPICARCREPFEAGHICGLEHIFVNATDCGHETWVTRDAAAGIHWCYICAAYVGVIVMRKECPLDDH